MECYIQCRVQLIHCFQSPPRCLQILFRYVPDLIHYYREESGKVKAENMHLHEQISSLKKDLMTLQENATTVEGAKVENTHLKTIIDTQQQKLKGYEEEITKTKEHLTRLEKFIQRIQEDRLSSSVS